MNIEGMQTMKMAAVVSKFLMDLSKRFPDRWHEIQRRTGVSYPFGDFAYAAALVDWYARGRPTDAWFSYAETEEEDPYVVAFQDELTREFELQILSKEEGAHRRMLTKKTIITKKVMDWGPN